MSEQIYTPNQYPADNNGSAAAGGNTTVGGSTAAGGNATVGGSTAAGGNASAYNTAAYTSPTTSYGAQGGQPQPVFVSYPGAVGAQQPRRGLSKPARVLLWICGIAAAATLLFACAAVWIVGLRAIVRPAADSSETPAQPPSGNYGNYGNYSDGSDSYGDGYGDYSPFGILPPFYNDEDSSQQQGGSSAGLGVKVQEI